MSATDKQPVAFNKQGGMQGWESSGVPPAAGSQPAASPPAQSWIHSRGDGNAALKTIQGLARSRTRESFSSFPGGADTQMLDQTSLFFCTLFCFHGSRLVHRVAVQLLPGRVSWELATGPVQLGLNWDACSLARKTQGIRHNQPKPALPLPGFKTR